MFATTFKIYEDVFDKKLFVFGVGCLLKMPVLH